MIARRLSQREKFKYYAVFIFFIYLSLAFQGYERPGVTGGLFFAGLLSAVLAVGGLVLCYKANNGNSGEDFIERFVCISWVVGIRMSVLLFLPYFAVYWFMTCGLNCTEFVEENFYVMQVKTVVFNVIYFLWIRRHIRRVAAETSST